jgi:hypothetical protein
MKNIIVVGYPKSGNTWITRLVSEILDCPIGGFWGIKNQHEIAIEGDIIRNNNQFCSYKSHHTFYQLKLTKNFENSKIIYVIRDPRDIVISSAHYFSCYESKVFEKFSRLIAKKQNILSKCLDISFKIENKRIWRQISIILHGDKQKKNDWRYVSWKEHYRTFYGKNVLFIRYEDMLDNSKNECYKILDFLNVRNLSEKQIDNAINKESFVNKKNHFLKLKDKKNVLFLRSGKKRQWADIFDKKQIDFFYSSIGEDLSLMGYD